MVVGVEGEGRACVGVVGVEGVGVGVSEGAGTRVTVGVWVGGVSIGDGKRFSGIVVGVGDSWIAGVGVVSGGVASWAKTKGKEISFKTSRKSKMRIIVFLINI